VENKPERNKTFTSTSPEKHFPNTHWCKRPILLVVRIYHETTKIDNKITENKDKTKATLSLVTEKTMFKNIWCWLFFF